MSHKPLTVNNLLPGMRVWVNGVEVVFVSYKNSVAVALQRGGGSIFGTALDDSRALVRHQSGLLEVSLDQISLEPPAPGAKTEEKPTFKKGDQVLVNGSPATVHDADCQSSIKVTLDGQKSWIRVPATSVTIPEEIKPAQVEQEPKSDLLSFIDTCSDEQMINFLAATKDAGSMNIVRKAIKAWVALAKDSSQ